MRRLHLIELEDQTWFPAPARDAGTDFLRFMLNLGNNYAPAVPLLARAVERAGARRIVDLCAGGGGPWQRLLPALAEQGVRCDVLLTDRFPNQDAAAALREVGPRPGEVSYHPEPVDALAVPAQLDGLRTVFSAFHHFPPAAATALIRDAVRAGAPIAVFESTERSAASMASVLLAPIILLLATPFLRPFRWSRLLLTYLIPLVPLLILWDGLVSCLRSYTPDELRALVDAIPEASAYEWHIGTLRGRAPVPITYLISTPRAG